MPQTISVRCPHCGSKMTVPAQYAGQEGNCSKCDGLLRIPDLQERPPAGPSAKPGTLPPKPPGTGPDTAGRPARQPPKNPAGAAPPQPPAAERRPQPAASSAPGWPPAPDEDVRPAPATPPATEHAERGPVPLRASPRSAAAGSGGAVYLGWALFAVSAVLTIMWAPAFALGLLVSVPFVALDGGRRLSRAGLIVWTLAMLPLWPLTLPWYLLGRKLKDGPLKLTPLRASLLMLLAVAQAAAFAISQGELLGP